MTYHYQDLGSASDWMKQIEPIRSSTQNLVMTRHQYGISALVPKPSFRGNTAGGVGKFRLLVRKKNKINVILFGSTIPDAVQYLRYTSRFII